MAAQLAIQEKEFDIAYNDINKIFASNDASNEQQVNAVSLLETISRFRNGTLDPVVIRRLAKLAQGQDNQLSRRSPFWRTGISVQKATTSRPKICRMMTSCACFRHIRWRSPFIN